VILVAPLKVYIFKDWVAFCKSAAAIENEKSLC